MTENPYRVLGLPVPPLLGRKALLRRIKRHLEKPSPDHVSVVGPAHYGKSVLLRHLAKEHPSESSGYLTTVHVDLRHGTPRSDGAFKQRLAEEIKKALQPYRLELSEWIDVEDLEVHDLMGLVLARVYRVGQKDKDKFCFCRDIGQPPRMTYGAESGVRSLGFRGLGFRTFCAVRPSSARASS